MSLHQRLRHSAMKARQPRSDAEQSSVLLVVVGPAVQLGVSGEAGGGERLLARGALQALLVPGRVVHPQQEAVCDDPRAARTHGVRGPVSAWKRGGPEKPSES